MTESYPLHWPEGWPRASRRDASRFDVSPRRARDELLHEIHSFGGRYPVLSTNIELRRDGLPYANQRTPEDPGVAVYFEKDGEQFVFACDQFLQPWENMRAIGKTINALRGIERWGASDLLKRSLQAFKALPSPRKWVDVLGIPPNTAVDEDYIRRRFRELAKELHPDSGGSAAAMAELIAARDAGIKALNDI